MTTIELLQSRFGGPLIRATEVGKMLGMNSRTVSNRISADQFILPVIKLGKHNYIDIRDLANYLDNAKAQF